MPLSTVSAGDDAAGRASSMRTEEDQHLTWTAHKAFSALGGKHHGDTVSADDFKSLIRNTGLMLDDSRIKDEVERLDSTPRLTLLSLREVVKRCALIEAAVCGRLAVPDFKGTCAALHDAFDAAMVAWSSLAAEGTNGKGANAAYIPQLAKVNPEQYALSVCSVDGQRWSLGNYAVPFCVQSCSKPITYCIAQAEHGETKVHEHVGREPSGRAFNELALAQRNDAGYELPHNPMINAGAIMCASLVRPKQPQAERFAACLDTWRRLSGGIFEPGFHNATYLSERATADSNFCLAYMMRGAGAFPEGTDIVKTLELYFMLCSIEMTCEAMSVAAATLANGGVCPLTGERVFSQSAVRNCLSLMSCCGMYDYSGEFQFRMGFPCKSGVAGALMIVIPGVMGICTWSPRLDRMGNSVFGVNLCQEIGKRFNFHTLGHFTSCTSNEQLTDSSNNEEEDCSCLREVRRRDEINVLDESGLVANQVALLYAAWEGDISRAMSLLCRGVNPDNVDYDLRGALHLAAEGGHEKLVTYLVSCQGANPTQRDRYGRTPSDCAASAGHGAVARFLSDAEIKWNSSRPSSRASSHVGSRSGSRAESGSFEGIPHPGQESFGTELAVEATAADDESNNCSESDDKNVVDLESARDKDSGATNGESSGKVQGSLSVHFGSLRSRSPAELNVDTTGNRDTLPPNKEDDDQLELYGGPIFGGVSSRGGTRFEAFTVLRALDSESGEGRVLRSKLESVLAKAGLETKWLPKLKNALDAAIPMRRLSQVANGSQWPDSSDTNETPQMMPKSVTVVTPKTEARIKVRRNSATYTLNDVLADRDVERVVEISEMEALIKACPVALRALRSELVVPDWSMVTSDLRDMYDEASANEGGAVADYIPTLASANPDQWGVAICSVDGQQQAFGDAETRFCVQSCSKPITYGIAVELVGEGVVHSHVGREPSGQNFNEVALSAKKLPHNPLINSGAIMTASLLHGLGPSQADRFERIVQTWEKLAGGRSVGFSNATFLSESATADRNRCLAYLMKGAGAFPEHVDSCEAVEEALELYFQCCSIELDCRQLSVVAATLANGGLSPVTGERIFEAATVKNMLTLCMTCGMYDYSGEFQFRMGFPCKSGVAGALMIVIPGVMGICTWSPRLDRLGNSERGIEFCRLLGERYSVHCFDTSSGDTSGDAGCLDGEKRNGEGNGHGSSRGNSTAITLGKALCHTRAVSVTSEATLKKKNMRFRGGGNHEHKLYTLMNAASQGDLATVRQLHGEGGVALLRAGDYDSRTTIHLAASEGQLAVVKYLARNGADVNAIDRWGGTAVNDAKQEGHNNIVTFLMRHGARRSRGLQAKSTTLLGLGRVSEEALEEEQY